MSAEYRQGTYCVLPIYMRFMLLLLLLTVVLLRLDGLRKEACPDREEAYVCPSCLLFPRFCAVDGSDCVGVSCRGRVELRTRKTFVAGGIE